MYVTSHRVRANDGRTGYNGFLYLHGDEPRQPSLDIRAVAEDPPGDCQGEVVGLPPGGNFVDAYLDVIAADDISVDALKEVFAEIEVDAPPHTNEVSLSTRIEDVAVRVYISNRTPGDYRDELGRLTNVITRLVEEHTGAHRPDFLIEEKSTSDGWYYELAAETKDALADDQREVFPIAISEQVREPLERKFGSIYPLLPDLLSPDSPVAEQFADVIVRHADTGEIIWSTGDS